MMKKILLILSLVVVFLLAGCNLGGAFSPADQTQPPTPTLSDEELAVPIDIDDSIVLIPTEEPVVEEEEAPAATNTPITIQPTRENVEPTATPLPEATPVPEVVEEEVEEEEQQEELSAESDDPAKVNGAPGWSEKFADPAAVAFIQDEDDFSKGEVVDSKLVFSGKKANIPAWRMAGTGGDALGRSYAEARITNAVCHSNDDSAGLFFRVPDIKNPTQGYLFGVTCGGQYYLKMWNGKAQPGGEMFTIIAPTDNEIIRRGEDKLNRLGVLSDGKGRTILYINGLAVDEFTSPVFANGYYGIFVTASTTAGFSVSIDAASVWYNVVVPTTSFQKERTTGSQEGSTGQFNFANLLSDTTADPSIVLGPPTWRDNLNSAANWGSFMNDYAIWSGNAHGELVITGLKQQSAWILAKTPKIGDGAVELVIDNDNCYMWDSYGIFFRSPIMQEGDRGYLFGVTCNSYYFVWRWDGKSGRMTQLVSYAQDVDHINYGADARNRLNVVAVGDQMNFYVNGHYMTTVVDNYWTEGHFGVFVRPQYTQGFTIRLDEASYWINE